MMTTVLQFPHARVRKPGEPARELGLGLLAQTLGVRRETLSGHWCSRCNGIWYGFLLEVTCPVCANRHG